MRGPAARRPSAERLTAREVAALVTAARGVRRCAHAPYSQFTVGAAILDERGEIHVGCNVENASFGLTVCAERHAVAAALAAGARRVRAIAVVTGARPAAPPCGACRQVLAEVAGPALPVLLAGPRGTPVERLTLGGLLPHAFALAPSRPPLRSGMRPRRAPPGRGLVPRSRARGGARSSP